LQSLYFLNDPFIHAQAKGLAARVLKGETDAGQGGSLDKN